MEVTLKKDQKCLSEDEKVDFNKDLGHAFIKLISKTKNSELFRCVICRKFTVRKIKESDIHIRIKGHTKNCKFRKLKRCIEKI